MHPPRELTLACIESLDASIAKRLASGMTEDDLLRAAETEIPRDDVERAIANYIRSWVLARRHGCRA
jgi:hypothetical protein